MACWCFSCGFWRCRHVDSDEAFISFSSTYVFFLCLPLHTAVETAFLYLILHSSHGKGPSTELSDFSKRELDPSCSKFSSSFSLHLCINILVHCVLPLFSGIDGQRTVCSCQNFWNSILWFIEKLKFRSKCDSYLSYLLQLRAQAKKFCNFSVSFQKHSLMFYENQMWTSFISISRDWRRSILTFDCALTSFMQIYKYECLVLFGASFVKFSFLICELDSGYFCVN